MATTDKTAGGAAEDASQWLVEAEQAKLWTDAFHILHLKVGEKEYADLHARRVFPLSNMVDYISLLDDKDKEVALLARPHKLDKASRAALEKALDRMYYVARILRVDEIKETMGVTHWQVQTDRGYAAFEVVDLHHVRKLPNGRYLIADADGNRFEIEDVQRLDSRSQKIVQSEI